MNLIAAYFIAGIIFSSWVISATGETMPVCLWLKLTTLWVAAPVILVWIIIEENRKPLNAPAEN